MIIRFGCSNFKSIFSYQELLFTASTLKDIQSELIHSDTIPDEILSCIAIYGANASGKTNLIKALRFLVNFIRNSYSRTSPSGINRSIFKLNTTAENETSNFDLDFVFEKKHYHYGYKINDEIVKEEWLFSYNYDNRKSRTVLFHRNSEEVEPYKFSKYLKGENKAIAKLTRGNSLYLSTAAQNNHDLLTGIYNFFTNNFSFRFDQQLNSAYIARELKKYGTLTQVSNFIKNTGAGIELIELKERNRNEKELDLLNKIHEAIISSLDEPKTEINVLSHTDDAIELSHKDQSGKLIPFELDDESLGTKAMIALMAPIFDVLNKGGVFVVDEIESSLHALLTIQIINLFGRKATNPNGAQLLFTTHETHILCSDILRRDQIWFSEKNFNGATTALPLTDYKLRSTDNFHKGYLEGRFGAIPFLGNIQKLFQIGLTQSG